MAVHGEKISKEEFGRMNILVLVESLDMTWYVLVHGMMEFKVEGSLLGSWRLFLQLFHGSRLVLRSSYEAPNDFNHLADLDAKDLHFVRSSPAQQCRELVGGHQQSCL